MRGSRPAQGDPTGKQKELCRGMVMLLLPSRYGVLVVMGRALVKCEQSVCSLAELGSEAALCFWPPCMGKARSLETLSLP